MSTEVLDAWLLPAVSVFFKYSFSPGSVRIGFYFSIPRLL